jgi:signal transduction histidine kinase
MNFRLDIQNYLLFISFIINFSLALLIYFSSKKSRANQVYTIIVLNVAAWCFGMFMYRGVQSSELAVFWAKFYYVATAIVPVSLLYFAYLFPRKKFFINKWLDIFLLAIALFFIASPFFGNFIIENVIPHYNVEDEIFFGTLLNAWGVYIISYFILAFFLLIKKYKESVGIEKLQIGYVLVGSFLSASIGTITNHIFPLYFDNPSFAWIGPFSTIIMVVFVSYAALKHHLFDVKVIATELFVFALWMIQLIKVFSSQDSDLVLNIGVLLSVIIVGILLIRSVIKEVEQKEKMEKMAKEIERAYEVEKGAHELANKANDELKNLDKLKNDFLKQTQHDLRTPLTIMMGYFDLLVGGSYGKLPKQASDVVKRMLDVAQNKLKDVNNFLDIEQFKMGKGVVSLEPGVELSTMLKEIMNVLEPKAQSKGIYLKLEESKEALTISADREKLKAAIFNIIDNAVKYTPKGGVNIKTGNHDGVKIIISDTGIGIPQDKIKNILEAQFERTKQAEKIAIGSGVGLYLSSQIIKLHNGKVWVESEGEGKGSTFHIELPVS